MVIGIIGVFAAIQEVNTVAALCRSEIHRSCSVCLDSSSETRWCCTRCNHRTVTRAAYLGGVALDLKNSLQPGRSGWEGRIGGVSHISVRVLRQSLIMVRGGWRKPSQRDGVRGN